MKMLHFAPENVFRRIFSQRFQQYETADLFMRGVDHKVDILSLPFKDATYDCIFASCVLEHISDDRKAIQEIRRILRPNGIALLSVPVVCTTTIEYPQANPGEGGHWRACGFDYFERYKKYFGDVKIYTSESFPEKYQPFAYEDRSVWPNKDCPLRPPMQGKKHAEFVPVCYA
jgi:ubiquinone/menaquinone biosynthesis C-methylase UbiE